MNRSNALQNEETEAEKVNDLGPGHRAFKELGQGQDSNSGGLTLKLHSML